MARAAASTTSGPVDSRTGADPFLLYGKLLGLLLAGYLLFDRAFAYLHLPGLPLYVGEILLLVGVLAVLRSTTSFRDAVSGEPVLTVLLAFIVWGSARTLPGIQQYGLDALRDAALWYYGAFAFLAMGAVAAHPRLPLVLADGLRRLTPVLLCWLVVSLLLAPVASQAPSVPFTTVSVLSHKPGGAAVAALLVLGVLWLLPWGGDRKRWVMWSILALLVVALVGTQNRGGILGFLAGATVGLAFLHDRVKLLARGAVIAALGLGLALLLSLEVPFPGLQGRDYSAAQLVTNFVSLTSADPPGNLAGTVDGRRVLWERTLDKQIDEGRILAGAGFGPNLASEVGILDEGEDSLRSPHNTHLHVFARMGMYGSVLWILFWGGWYWRMAAASRRLRHEGRYVDRQVAGVCLALTTTVLVSSVFDPQLEGPQVAVLLWSIVGIGLAVTKRDP
jgi:hypothetical protein